MANRPIQTNLPANLPTNWTQNQIVAPDGSDVGQSTEYGYNYLNRQINDAQTAVNTINAAFDNVAATDTPAPAYGVCSTAASTAAKAVTVTGSAATFALFAGVSVRVLFSNANTASNPTLNVNNTGAIPIQSRNGTNVEPGTWNAGEVLDLVYTGTSWVVVSFSGFKIVRVLKTEIFTEDATWTAPGNIENDTVNLLLFGGGGGGGRESTSNNYASASGGGGGHMYNAPVVITPNQTYSITIGAGGAVGTSGGVTSFGTLASASGGTYGTGSGAGSAVGGSGGTGGGSFGAANGAAGSYGGGSGACLAGGASSTGGNGGTYGGGGGSSGTTPGTGGTYGGNGGYLDSANSSLVAAQNGTDTRSLDLEFTGAGTAGSSSTGTYRNNLRVAGGGGGGYGGNGSGGNIQIHSETYGGYCGSGGGYGANGGSGYHQFKYSSDWNASGGGGGYGGNGGSASYGTGSNSNVYVLGGGGGGYGTTKLTGTAGGYGYGAGGGGRGAGAQGIAILRYYIYQVTEV